jgi:Tfx family DNA-binding protein
VALTEKEINVLKLRAQRLTQVEVAKRLQISQAAVSDFEKNARRKIEEARATLKLAEELEVNNG